jgi:acetyl-CoA carboxylase biotin carboxyl carrier protein
MDIRKIRKLIELLQETGIAEIEIKEGEESLRLSRYSPAPVEMAPSQKVMPASIPHPISTPVDDVPALAAHEKSTSIPSGHKVCSPMVGTVFLAPSPEAPPFVAIGQTVKVGDALCMIEAMKMFNEVEADKAGIITAILIKNGAPVEYNQPLFIIEG